MKTQPKKLAELHKRVVDECDVPHRKMAIRKVGKLLHELIALERIVEFGLSPASPAGQRGEQPHTPECRERFDRLITKGSFQLSRKRASGD